MKIRRATVKDVNGCLDLQKSYGEKFWKRENFVRAATDEDAIFLVMEEDEEIIGSVLGCLNLVKRDEAFLQETRVHKKQERKGIGKKLVNEFLKVAQCKGVKEVFAEIENEHIPFYIAACKFKDRGKHVLISKRLR